MGSQAHREFPAEQRRNQGRLIESGIQEETVEKVFDLHKRRVERFQKKGYQPAPAASQEDRRAAIRAYYSNPVISQRLRRMGVNYLINLLLILGMSVSMVFFR